MKLSSLRVGLRLARRELRARPARAALVILLIIIPTTAMTVVTTFFRTSELSWRDVRVQKYGTAQYRAYFTGSVDPETLRRSYSGPSDADIEALRTSVPTGTPFVVERSTVDRVRGADFVEQFSLVDVDLTSPLVRGRYDLVAGRAPTSADEAAIGEELADALHAHLGSVIKPDRLGAAVRIVGVVRAEPYNALLFTHAPLPPRQTLNVYIGHTRARPEADGWQIDGGMPFNVSHTDRVRWTYVGGAIGMFALGTIVAAAFALGARRQLRTIGLLSASGAPPRTVAWALTAQGAFAGALGSMIGITLGLVGVRLLPLHILQSITNRNVSSPAVHPADLIPIAVLGVVAAMAAAAFPARAAARLAVLQALASRRPISRARRGAWFVAIAVLALSAAVLAWTVRSVEVEGSTTATVVMVLASVLPFVSALIAAPLVVGRLERWVRGAPLPWRLAGRSLARNRSRSASVVGATCAVVGLVVAGATFVRSQTPDVDPYSSVGSAVYRNVYLQPNQALVFTEQGFEPDANGNVPDAVYQPKSVDEAILTRTQALIPSARRIDLTRLVDAQGINAYYWLDSYYIGSTYGNVPLLAVASPELLDLFDVSAELRDRLAAGDVVVVRSRGVRAGGPLPGEAAQGATLLHVGGFAETREAAVGLPRILISAARAAELGWHTVPAGVTVFAAPRDFTASERKQLQLLERDMQWEQEFTNSPPAPGAAFEQTGINVGDRSTADISPLMLRLLGFVATAVLVLGVVGLGLGLAARDSQDETAVLDAVGAPPRVRRQVGTRRAVLLVVVACAIALPAGVIPVAAIVLSSTRTDWHFHMDWLALFALAIALPAVIAMTAAGGGWLRDRLRGPRADVIAVAD